eukprot:237197_1
MLTVGTQQNNTNAYRKKLLLMRKHLLIKMCKKYKVSTFGTKKDIIERIIHAKNKKNIIKRKHHKASLNAITIPNLSPIENKQNNEHDQKNDQVKFIHYMSFADLKKLNINDKIDHRNIFGKFIGATIVDKQYTKYKILYEDNDEYKRENTIWSDYEIETHKFAKYASISKCIANKMNYLEIKDNIDVNPHYNGHTGWRPGVIKEIDENSGQINVTYEINDNEYCTIWVDVANKKEIAEYGTQSPLNMLKTHNYDAFFNLKKNSANVQVIKQKIHQCFAYIKNQIYPKKK